MGNINWRNEMTQASYSIDDLITFNQVQSVYSGKSGACSCGCAGKHTYREDLKSRGKELRGYELDDDDCNDRVVQRHINTINKAIAAGEASNDGDGIVSYDNGKRVFVAYLLASTGETKCTK